MTTPGYASERQKWCHVIQPQTRTNKPKLVIMSRDMKRTWHHTGHGDTANHLKNNRVSVIFRCCCEGKD
jgi:hypothetical protein